MKKNINEFIEVKKSHKNRLIFVFILIIIYILGVIYKLYAVQIKEHEKWKSMGQKTVKFVVSKKRGTIYDRNMGKLAISMPVKSCYICPDEVASNPEKIVSELSKKLNIPREKILQAITKKSKFVWIKRALPEKLADEIQKLNLPGVYFKNEFKRFYPYGKIAANLIGGVGQDEKGMLDNKGLEGIEMVYDNYLKGVSGIFKKQFDPKSTDIIKNLDVNSQLFGGISVYLTIDDIIQSIIEKELDNLCELYNPKSAFIIVQNPLTGEILGIGNRPTYDPNNITKSKAEMRRNHALLDIYEPGSTFKILTFASAIEEKVISENDTFNCTGLIRLWNDQFAIKCHTPHGKQTFYDAFSNSCNPATIQIASRLGKDKFYEYIKKAGFGSLTNILPNAGESPGIVREPKKWSVLSLPSISIGQEIGVNAIQLISLASAIINDGIMMKPLLVSALEDSNSGFVRKFETTQVGRIFSKETCEKMKKALRMVVLSGTGKKAMIEGYDILGKTGTAQKAGQRSYESGKYVSSFIGFINEPHFKLTIYVVINEPVLPPGFKDVHGGTVAAPAFKNVAEKILMYYNILPEEKKIETFISSNELQNMIKIPDIVGLTVKEVKEKYNDKINIQFIGDGPIVVKQFPKPFKFLNKSESLIAYLGTPDDLTVNQKQENMYFMPMLIGKSMKEALEIFKNSNFKLEFSGSGFVSEQFPNPGEFLTSDSIIKLKFSMKTIR